MISPDYFVEKLIGRDYFSQLFIQRDATRQKIEEYGVKDSIIAAPQNSAWDHILTLVAQEEERLREEGTYILGDGPEVFVRGDLRATYDPTLDILFTHDVYKQIGYLKRHEKTIVEKRNSAIFLFERMHSFSFYKHSDNHRYSDFERKKVYVCTGEPADMSGYMEQTQMSVRLVQDIFRAHDSTIVDSVDAADVAVYFGWQYCDRDTDKVEMLWKVLQSVQRSPEKTLVTIVNGDTAHLCRDEEIVKDVLRLEDQKKALMVSRYHPYHF